MRKLFSLVAVLLLVGLAAWAGTPVNLKTAIDNQPALVAQRPTDAAAHNDLGNLLVLDGDLGGAEQAYRRAIELDPQRLTAHFNLGLLQQQRGESRAAMQSFRRVLEIDGRHAWAHYQIGMTKNEAIVRIVSIGVVGLFLGWLRSSTGRLGAGMAAHAGYNFLIVLITLAVLNA